MKKKMLVLGLTADRIDLLLCQGDRVHGSIRIPIALPADPDKWAKALMDCAKPVKSAAEQLGAAGLTTTVLYQSPTECADYSSLNLRSANEARQAAMLASAEKLNCPLDNAIFRSEVMGRDRSTATPSLHVVVAADRSETIDTIAAMVDRAGLVFGTATPIDAIAMSRLVGMGLSAKDQRRAYLYVGDQRSFFVIADAGNVLFARPISMGVNSLITCLTRPMRTGQEARTVELDRETARLTLHQFGFAERSQVVHEAKGITGAHVLPLLQPVLQRFVVELRQSLRFALPEDQRTEIVIHAMGPGAGLPGFSEILSTELRLAVEVDPSCKGYDCRKPDSPGGELTDAIRAARALEQLGLEPHAIEVGRNVARMRRWLCTGAATCLAVIGLDYFRNHSKLVDIRRQTQIVASSSDELKSVQATGERLEAAMQAMDALEATIARETGARISPRAVLQELSRVTPPSIRLTEISLRRNDVKVVGSISGYSLLDADGNRTRDLETFIDRLRQSPLLEDVVLSNVQDRSSPTASGQRFDTLFTSVIAPQGNAAVTNPQAAATAHATVAADAGGAER